MKSLIEQQTISDLRTVKVPKYEPLYPSVKDLIPKRVEYYQNLSVLAAARMNLITWKKTI